MHPVTIEHLDRYWQMMVQAYQDSAEQKVSWQAAWERFEKAGGKFRTGPALAALAVATKRAGVWNVPTLTVSIGTPDSSAGAAGSMDGTALPE